MLSIDVGIKGLNQAFRAPESGAAQLLTKKPEPLLPMDLLLHPQFISWTLKVAGIILSASVAFVFLISFRRYRRNGYFRRFDRLRESCQPVIADILSSRIDYQQGLRELRLRTGRDRIHLLERLCFESPVNSEEFPRLRRLCEDLGLVSAWQERLSGRQAPLSLPFGLLSFAGRASSAEYLGRIEHQPSWPLLVSALEDPHPDVRSVAARALGAIREPRSFPGLLRHLHQAVLTPSSRLSYRTLKTSLAQFPLDQAIELLASLEHPHPRIRFAATDLIREMVASQAAAQPDFTLAPPVFPSQLACVFLHRLAADSDPDIRARAAAVIGRFAEMVYAASETPAQVLAKLADDSCWFVRMHAVRTMAGSRRADRAAVIRPRLTDPHWRVRQEAARSMFDLGEEGIGQLIDHLLETEDRHSREQVAEQIQQNGYIRGLLDRYAAGATRERRVIEQLVWMDRTSHLLSVLRQPELAAARAALARDFADHDDARIRAWANRLAVEQS